MKKILLFLSFLLMSIWVWGDTWTWTASAGNNLGSSNGNVTLNGKTWTVSRSSWTQAGTMNNGCIQVGSKNNPSTLTLTTSAFSAYTVTKVEVVCSSYGGNHKISISVDGNSYLSATSTPSGDGSWAAKKEGSGSSSGNIVIDFTKGSDAWRAMYIKSITVTYNSSTPSYTITAQSNDTSYGTVSENNGVITATPATGYRVSLTTPYTVLSGTATVSQDGNDFTVTPSSNCTITINFEPIPTYTVRFINSGGVYAERLNIKEYSIITDFPTDIVPNEDCKNNGWGFIGWTETKNGTTTIDELTVTKNDTLYALYKLTDVGINYVTDTLTKETFAPYENNNYKSYENIVMPSGSIYAGNSAGGEGALQLRSGTTKPGSPHSGIFNTTSIGLIDNVKLKWNTTIKDQNDKIKNIGKTVKFYLNDDAYESADDMYSGKHIEDSISYDIGRIVLKEKPYIGIRSKSGAIYFDSIFITWKILENTPLYSTNPKCYDAGVSVVHWYKDSIKFGIDEIGASTDVILYATNDTISEYTHIPDSSYKFAIQDIDTLKCTDLKFITIKSNGDECIRRFSIPIMIDSETNILCDSCDVAILSNGQLNIENDTVSGNVIIYEGGLLNVKSGNIYSVNSLTLRRDNDSVPCLSNNGTLSITDKLFFELRTDGSDWRWLSLPKDFNAEDLKTSDEVLLRYYNGEYRAHNRYGGWKNAVDDNKTINAYEGFLFGVALDTDEKRIYRYELNKSVLSTETSNKNGAYVTAYTDENTKPNNHGWNVIGVPYFDKYTPSYTTNSITIGDTVVRYAVIPSKSNAEEIVLAGGYEEILLDGSYALKPFTAFFIQAANTDTLSFNVYEKIKRAPRLQKLNKETLLRFNVDYKQMGVFIDNEFTDEYELGNDLESLYSFYQIINGYKLLYSAVNDSIIEHGIKIYASGNLHIDGNTNLNDFEEISVLYNGDWYDLLHGQTLDVVGEFILQAKRKTHNVATGLDESNVNSEFNKYIHNGNIYIRKNNRIFTVLGEIVK